MTYAKALRTIMDRHEISPVELAKRLGTTRGYVSQLMSGTIGEPRLRRAFEIADAIGCDISEFTSFMYEATPSKSEQ